MRTPRREQPRLAYGQTMHTVRDGPKVVALTIDDGPSPVYTPQVLRILRQYGIAASFSMIDAILVAARVSELASE